MIVSNSRTMHPQSSPLTIGETVLKESDDLVILGVTFYSKMTFVSKMTFDSKMTFEKHLRMVSRAASQRLGILRKSCRVFHGRSLLGRCFRGFVLPVLEYCSAMWCSAADTHLKLLDRAVSGAQFLHSVTLLIVDLMQFCVCWIRSCVTRCTPLMMLFLDRMCQCGLHAVPWSHIGILMRRRTFVQKCTTGLLFPSQYPSGTILLAPYSMVWDWRVSRAGPMFFIGLSCSIPTIVFYYFSLCVFSVYRLVLWGWGLRADRLVVYHSLPAFYCRPLLIIILRIIIPLFKNIFILHFDILIN